MIRVCIYKKNRGLGACVGPVSRVKVANRKTQAWQGLHDLAERLQTQDEEPGVCKAHEQRGADNGFVLDLATTAPAEELTVDKRNSGPAATPSNSAREKVRSGKNKALCNRRKEIHA